MQNLHLQRRVEFFSNIAIIIIAVLVGSVFLSRYILSDSPKTFRTETETIQVGTKINLSEIDWNPNSKTLLLALSTTCSYCTQSLPFYKKILEKKKGRDDVKVIVVAPQSAEKTRQYLAENGISVDAVREASLDEISVKATPTLILLDDAGVVINSWVGKLSATKEKEVAKSLLGQTVDL